MAGKGGEAAGAWDCPGCRREELLRRIADLHAKEMVTKEVFQGMKGRTMKAMKRDLLGQLARQRGQFEALASDAAESVVLVAGLAAVLVP